MNGSYLLPEDVSPAHAEEVLASLNAAASAEELAAAIEIPGEVDIGVRIAARILERRDALGGFTSIDQVYAVPYVGPERFTELVTSLSGARPPSARPARTDAGAVAQLEARLSTLERTRDAAATIRLRPLRDEVWLGEEIPLLAEVRDARGQPLVDTSLSLVTTWGRLTGRAGARTVAGNSVVVRTDHLGLAKLRLAAASAEALNAVEESSLYAALAALGDGTASPRDNLDALTALARHYRESGNHRLRRAVDVYYRRHAAEAAATSAPVDSLAAWPRIAVTVLAYLTPEPAAPTSRPSTSLVTVHVRDWLYAWIWAYRRMLETDSTLPGSLVDVKGDDRSSGGAKSDLFARIGSFLDLQRGWVGQAVGQDFARTSLTGFLQSSLDKFPEAERNALLTGVTSGAKSVAAGKELLSASELNRAELSTKIDATRRNVDELMTIGDRVEQLEGTAVTRAQLDEARSEILEQASAETRGQLDGLRSEVAESLGAKADASAVADLDAKLGELASRSEALEKASAETRGQLDDLRSEVTESLATKADAGAVADLGEELDKLESRNVSLEGEVRELQARDADFEEKLGALDARGAALEKQVKTLAGDTRGIDERTAKLETEASRVSERVSVLERQGKTVDRDITDIQKRLDVMARDIEELKRRR